MRAANGELLESVMFFRLIIGSFAIIGAGDFAHACNEGELFSRMLANPGNIRLSMDYGECALENGDLESAVSTFERVLIYDPDNAKLEVSVAGLYAQMKADDLAAQHYQAALSSSRLDAETARDAEAGLARVSSIASDEEGFSLTTYSAYRYQDNVNLGLRSSTININGLIVNVPLSLQGRADASFWHEGKASYLSGEIFKGVSLLAELEWQINKQEKAFPLEAMAIEGRFGPVFKLGDFSQAMEGWSLHTYILGEKTQLFHQPLYDSLGAGFQLNKAISPSVELNSQLEYRQFWYDDNFRRPGGSDNDGHLLDGSLSLTKEFSETVETTVSINASRFDVTSYFEDYWSAGAEVDVSLKFGEFGAELTPVTLTVGAGVEYRNYDDVAPGTIVSSREDFDYWIDASLDIPLNENLSFVPKIEHLRASSDIVLGNYYATTVMAGLRTKF